MCRLIANKGFRILSASVCITLFGSFGFAKANPELVKEEAGFYYGYGKGATEAEAISMAKRDLVETALTATLKSTNPKASRIKVSNESAEVRLPKEKPFAKDKKGLTVAYRMKQVDWEKNEKDFSNQLRSSLISRYEGISSKNKVSDKINDSIEILNVLADNGETELLTIKEDSTELFSKKIESICEDIVKNLTFTISTKDGFISNDSKFSVKVSDSNGKSISELSVKILWEVAQIITSSSEEEIPEVVATVKTDSNGEAQIEYPDSENFKNKNVTLTVSTAFAMSPQATKKMIKFDTQSAVDACYTHFDDLNEAYKTVDIPAGEFNAGAVPQDTKAGKREVSRKVKTSAYSMSLTPVTNGEYASFLHITRNENRPEYFDNEKYNDEKQPVVGISYADAEIYAQWLSEKTGNKYRLPTEEEWEKAARAGKNSIYPWGDESPKKSKNANYKGNGKYKNVPSPVGAFETGCNEWGIADMSGNVWEWTSSTHSSEDFHTVKGGSWMDGELELRISNYKDIDSNNISADVGFRLVKEISK